MTSASYPVGSSPAPSQQSFLVHLQTLTDISRELQTQVEGITKPLDSVAQVLTAPPAFGPFAEATTLGGWSQDAAAQMQGLIGDVRAALGFADEVTRTVATGYAQADDDISWGIGGRAISGAIGTVVGVTSGTVGPAAAAVGGVAAGLTHTVGGVVDGVDQTVQGVTHGVEPTLDGVTHGVDQAVGGATEAVPVGSIVGALTGQDRGGIR